ncbi:MAG: ParB/RepB/Spo0J family partition protein [Acidimicrobiales bacterium]|nr:ParB/RepB/Spo0J family partition protein [Acidimicrobiales bacterium]
MARPSGLGRGLSALIPTDVTVDRGASFLDIALDHIEPNHLQPRKHFDEDALASLTASVRELGVLQPILVRAIEGGDRYELIAGERRWRAAKRAGMVSIPAIVKTTNDTHSLEQALVENLHRQDLNPLEEAAAYQQLIEDFQLTHDDVAKRMGKSRAAITNTLRLFQLPPTVQRMVADGQLAAGHARALLGTPDRGFQEALAKRAVAESLSVRAVEDEVRTHNQPEDAPQDEPAAPAPAETLDTPQPKRLRPPGFRELEELLAELLDTRVSVDLGKNKGRVVIEFADLEDLERIYRRITEPQQQ